MEIESPARRLPAGTLARAEERDGAGENGSDSKVNGLCLDAFGICDLGFEA